MEKIKNHKYELTLFIVDAIGMILELAASRILSPYFGSSNMVWTCVIAIILLSSSIGHYYGGQIADAENKKENLECILALASLMIFIIPVISDGIVSSISMTIRSVRIGAMLATGILFLIPSILLGLISPIVLKLKLNNLDDAGKTAGKLSAFSTLGAIIGTISGGFFLIPNFGCMNILFILAIVIAGLKILINPKLKDKFNILCLILIIASFFSMYVVSTINKVSSEKVLSGIVGPKYSEDTEYGRALIYNVKKDNDIIRVFDVDNGFESISYIDDRKYTPYNGYIVEYSRVFDTKDNINDVLLLGGAGYSFPKGFISTRKSGTIDVVEIDEKITELARKYFFLDDLKKDFDLDKNNRLNIITDDGRMYLNNCKKKYDLIINDAFSGETPAKTLTTLEAVSKIKEALNNGGIYTTNILGSLEGKNSRFLMAEANTINKYFKHVYYLPATTDPKGYTDNKKVTNFVLYASDNELNISGAKKLSFLENEFVFTDDFCPVESMTFYES